MAVDFSYCDIVLFDMETAGLGLYDDVIQIAAHGKYYDNSSFNKYLIPPHKIPPQTTRINGFSYENGFLYQHGQRYRPVRARFGFRNFLNYLASFDNPVILVAHNAFGFDRDRIIKLSQRLNLYHPFANLVAGFADSLQIIRRLYPNRRNEKNSRRPYALQTLALDLLDDVDVDDFHNAVYDVQFLDEILDQLNINEYDIKNFARPL